MEIIVTFPNLVIAIHIFDLIKKIYSLLKRVIIYKQQPSFKKIINRNLIHDNNNKINLIFFKA